MCIAQTLSFLITSNKNLKNNLQPSNLLISYKVFEAGWVVPHIQNYGILDYVKENAIYFSNSSFFWITFSAISVAIFISFAN